MKESILVYIKNHDRRNNSVFKHGIILSIKLLVQLGFYLMERVSSKEKIAITACLFVVILMLSTRIYSFVFEQASLSDLLGTIGASLIFLGLALAPKLFFTPVKQVFSKSYVVPALISQRLHQSLVFSGCLLSVASLFTRMLH